MNLLAWNLHDSETLWLFVLLLPVLLIQAKRSGDEAGAKLILGVLSGTLLVILLFDPEMLIVLVALPFALLVLFIGWVRRL